MLLDTGPMVALLTEKDSPSYETFELIFETFLGNLITTLPSITEAVHLVGNWHFKSLILGWIEDKSILVLSLGESDLSRLSTLMEKYRDTPMDFADASLVVAAEVLKAKQIFTSDTDFSVYRINGSDRFEIVP